MIGANAAVDHGPLAASSRSTHGGLREANG
jgi:hypothetical protein